MNEKQNNFNKLIELCTQLKLLASIIPGEKIYLSKKTTFKSNNLITWFYRLYEGENRDDTLIYIKDIIFTTMEQLDKNIDANLYNDLINSKVGIENLKSTYSDDKFFVLIYFLSL